MRIGLYGGTFDPVHYGHLLVAETCLEEAALDQVWFIPAATSPHKAQQESATGEQRIAMLKLAIAGHPCFSINDMEIKRGGLSYTVDTLRTIKSDHLSDSFFFLMGGDSLEDFPTWKAPSEICRLSTPLVIARPGSPEPRFDRLTPIVDEQRLAAIEAQQVQMPQIDLSSTDIRTRVAAGRSIRFRLPRAVEKFIAANRLYQTTNPKSG